jgi:KaiC/GvpD/RAD55 family RecA-like ATPase
MLAAEMANVDNEVRRELLTMTNGVERMRIVLQEIEEAISMNQARKVADSITDELDEDDKDLKVRTIVRMWKREKHFPRR